MTIWAAEEMEEEAADLNDPEGNEAEEAAMAEMTRDAVEDAVEDVVKDTVAPIHEAIEGLYNTNEERIIKFSNIKKWQIYPI
jgi:hypothetical protein